MKISLKAYLLHEGECFPPWYYGFSYYLFCTGYSVYYIIPFNFFVRWHRWCRMKWDVWRCKAGSTTVRLRRISKSREHRAYFKGLVEGEEKGIRFIKALLTDEERKALHGRIK